MNNTLANQEKSIFVIIGGTSGIGKALAMQLRNDNNIVHIASRHTGVDMSNEKSICEYFESIGPFDHLIVTAGSSAPAGKVTDVAIEDAKTAFDTKFNEMVRPSLQLNLKWFSLKRKVPNE